MEESLTLLDLRGLDPEPWGARLVRARERAGVTTRELVAALDGWMTKGSIYALEHLDDAPTKKSDRQRALLVLVFCGTDPTEFGLEVTDTPLGVDLRRFKMLGEHYRAERAVGSDAATALAVAQSACISRYLPATPLAA